jgi:hypothetical protein
MLIIRRQCRRVVGHVEGLGKGRGVYRVLVERAHWRDQGVDGRIILRLIFKMWDVGVWIGLN